MSLSENEFELGAGEAKGVGVTIDVPGDAVGDYSARLRIESR